MELENIPIGEQVSIESSNENKMIQLSTRVISFEDEKDIKFENAIRKKYANLSFIFLEIIKAQERNVDFESDIVESKLIYVKDRRPHLWENIKIINITFPTAGRVHLVTSSNKGKYHNRREGYRLPIDCRGIVTTSSGKEIDVDIKDLSSGGVGFIARDKNSFAEGDRVGVSFHCDIKFSLTCRIIRMHELESGEVIIGGQFDNVSDSIGEFVAKKQRERRKQHMKPR